MHVEFARIPPHPLPSSRLCPDPPRRRPVPCAAYGRPFLERSGKAGLLRVVPGPVVQRTGKGPHRPNRGDADDRRDAGANRAGSSPPRLCCTSSGDWPRRRLRSDYWPWSWLRRREKSTLAGRRLMPWRASCWPSNGSPCRRRCANLTWACAISAASCRRQGERSPARRPRPNRPSSGSTAIAQDWRRDWRWPPCRYSIG